MLNSNKLDLLSITKSLNSLLLIGFCIAMLSNAILATVVLKAYTNKSRTITPPTISQAFTISDTGVDSAYLQQMATYFALLKLNVTPGSVDYQYSQLESYVNEQRWHQVQPQLLEEKTTIKRQNISSHFTITKAQVALGDNMVKLTGNLNKYVGKRALPTETASYIVSMDYDNGQLSLLAIQKLTPEEKP